MGTFVKVNPGDTKFAGVYYRKNKAGVKTFYASYRRNRKCIMEPVGKETDSITAQDAIHCRAARVKIEKDNLSITMDEAFKQFVETYAPMQGLKSVTSEISRYTTHIGPVFGKKKLDKIKDHHILLQKIAWKRNVKVTTVTQIMLLISRIYMAMSKIGVYKGPNPVHEAGVERSEIQRLRTPNVEEVDQLLATLAIINRDTMYQCAFAAYAGLRRNEILALRPIDINLDDNVLYAKTKHKDNKTKIESVIILPKLKTFIEDLMFDKMPRQTEKFFKAPFNYRHFNQALDQLGLNDGLDKGDTVNRIVLHSLRHAYATELIRANAHPLVVQRMMRHATYAATKRYVHIKDDQMREAAAALQTRLEG